MAKSPAKAETKAERAEREARELLEYPSDSDMQRFDRFMERLVRIPKEEIDKAVAPPKRGR